MYAFEPIQGGRLPGSPILPPVPSLIPPVGRPMLPPMPSVVPTPPAPMIPRIPGVTMSGSTFSGRTLAGFGDATPPPKPTTPPASGMEWVLKTRWVPGPPPTQVNEWVQQKIVVTATGKILGLPWWVVAVAGVEAVYHFVLRTPRQAPGRQTARRR